MEESHQDHGHGFSNKVGGVHESADISGIKVATEDVEYDMIGILRRLRKLTLDLHLRLFDLCTELDPLIDVTLTGGRSTYEVISCRHGSGHIQCVEQGLEFSDLTQSRTKNLKRRGNEMLDVNESVLPHPRKVIKPRARQQYLEGTRDSNQPDSLHSTSSVANNRGGGTEAPPQGQSIERWDINGLVPQESAYNASRGRGVPFNIKQENEDLWKMLNCVVCIDKPRCVVFLPCGHLVLCWDCAVHVEKECPICQRDILDRKIAQFS